MQKAYITTGHLIDKNTIKLDEDFSLAILNFRVVLEPVSLDTIKPNSQKKSELNYINQFRQREKLLQIKLYPKSEPDELFRN